MLPVEQKELAYTPNSTEAKALEAAGGLAEVVTSLHPEAAKIPLGEAVVQTLSLLREADLCVPSVYVPNSRFLLTGSDARRVLGGTPKDWIQPGLLWEKLAQGNKTLRENPAVRSLIGGGKFDTDIRFVLKKEASMNDVAEVVTKGLKAMPCIVVLEPQQHGTSRQLRVLLDGKYYLDLGALWDYRRADPYSEQVRDDARMSHYLPWRLFGSAVYITDGDQLVMQPEDRQSFWFAPYLNFGIKNADLPQALIGWFGAKTMDHWWPPQKTVTRLPSYYQSYREPDFWPRITQNSVGREDRIVDRAPEIATKALLLLTVNPDIGQEMAADGILRQLALGECWDGNGLRPAGDYQKRLQSGRLAPEQSGPALLARHLGKTLSEVVDLCTPRSSRFS